MREIPEKPLAIQHIRPRFSIDTDMSMEEVGDKLKQGLEKDKSCIGFVKRNYAAIFLPAEEQHYWSPQLKISMDELEDGKTEVRGMYGPRPAVWTMFVFFYFFIAVATLIITIIGYSNMRLDKSATILWWVPVLVIVFFSLYLTSHLGKMKGKSQIITLHKFFENATGIEVLPRKKEED